jgi:serine/threonine protein kinase
MIFIGAFCFLARELRESKMSTHITIAAPLSLQQRIKPAGIEKNTHLFNGRYHLRQIIGRGGTAHVSLAEDTWRNNALVAIKHIQIAGLTPRQVDAANRQGLHEAEILRMLSHPGIPHFYESGIENNAVFFVLQYIADSITLEEYLADLAGHPEQVHINDVLHIGIQLCTILDYLHTHQPPVISRDLKPANILLTEDGQLSLVDFGIARVIGWPTAVGDGYGTYGYAPPELYPDWRGVVRSSPRSDVYSLGAILHQMLSEETPEKKPKKQQFHFASLDRAVPELLGHMVMRMLRCDPRRRPHVTFVYETLKALAVASA